MNVSGSARTTLSVTARLGLANQGIRRQKVRAMPQQRWSKKRERQYEHIKAGLLDQDYERGHGRGDRGAHGQQGAGPVRRVREQEPHIDSRYLLGRRGGLRSGSGPGGRTKDQLYAEAKKKNIKGRSTMNKRELEKAVGR
jgi:hypothetical protein